MSEGTQLCGRPVVRRRAGHYEHIPSRKYFRVLVDVLSWGSHIESYKAVVHSLPNSQRVTPRKSFPLAKPFLQGGSSQFTSAHEQVYFLPREARPLAVGMGLHLRQEGTRAMTLQPGPEWPCSCSCPCPTESRGAETMTYLCRMSLRCFESFLGLTAQFQHSIKEGS